MHWKKQTKTNIVIIICSNICSHSKRVNCSIYSANIWLNIQIYFTIIKKNKPETHFNFKFYYSTYARWSLFVFFTYIYFYPYEVIFKNINYRKVKKHIRNCKINIHICRLLFECFSFTYILNIIELHNSRLICFSTTYMQRRWRTHILNVSRQLNYIVYKLTCSKLQSVFIKHQMNARNISAASTQ